MSVILVRLIIQLSTCCFPIFVQFNYFCTLWVILAINTSKHLARSKGGRFDVWFLKPSALGYLLLFVFYYFYFLDRMMILSIEVAFICF